VTSAQEAALAAGRPVRQEFYVLRPEDDAHTAFESYLFDAGIYGVAGLRRVTNPGVRKWRVANVSPAQEGRLEATTWTIEVDNRDGAFLHKVGSLFEHSVTAYLAWPEQCYLQHRVSVLLLSGVWSELTEIRYKGRIVRVGYVDGQTAAGEIVPLSASIRTEDASAWEAMRRPFAVTDAYDEQVYDAGGFGDTHWTVT